MSLKLTLNRNVFASLLLLISNCKGITRTVLEDCERLYNRNRLATDVWEAKELCSQNQQSKRTTPIYVFNLPPCVPWTPDLMTSVLQTSFHWEISHDQSLKNITDGNYDTCASTDYERSASIGVTLLHQVHIYAVRIATYTDPYKTLGKYPYVYVLGDHGKRMDCDVCTICQGPRLLDFYCPKTTVGKKIVICDVQPKKSYFSICDLKIYLREDKRKKLETTTPISESKTEPMMSSKGMSLAIVIIIAVLCCVVLLVIAFLIGKIVHMKKKSCPQKIRYDVKSERVEINDVYESDDVYQPVADYQPEYHIYNTVVYEEIGPRPDLLEYCDNIYSEPDDPKIPATDVLASSARFRENEVYTNPDSQDMMKKITDCGLKIKQEQSVDSNAVSALPSDLQDSSSEMNKSVDSVTGFRENEIYTNPDSQDMMKKITDCGLKIKHELQSVDSNAVSALPSDLQDSSSQMKKPVVSITRFRENEIYTNPDSQDMMKKITERGQKNKHEQSVDSNAFSALPSGLQDSSSEMKKPVDSVTRFRENDVYTNAYSQGMVKDKIDSYIVS